jgi:hypothetical protein
MPYEGDLLTACPADIDFSLTQAVVVSGASWNPCGHMILCAGNNSATSWYFHVAGAGRSEIYGVYAYPKFMREADYVRYLADNGKHEIRRIDAGIKNAGKAYTRLMELMADKWFWRVLPHNCASFAKEIVEAGGGSLQVLLNCPDQEVVRSLIEGIRGAVERATDIPRLNPGPFPNFPTGPKW